MPALEIFDFSMLDCYRLCPKKFQWRMLEHLVPKGDRNYIPAFGSAIHEALEAYYTGGDAIQAFIDYWTPFEGLDPRGNRTMKRGLTIISQYQERYPFESEPFTLIHSEMGFGVELGKYVFCGKTDGIVEWKGLLKGLVILENKTSSSKGYLTIKPNHQLDGYIYGPSQLITKEIVGACLNQIYHTAVDFTKNEFVRELTYRTKEEIEDWKADTLTWIELANSGSYPKNTKSCGAFFRACEYKQLCCADKSIIPALIDSLYDITPWNPYHDARKEDKKR